VKTAAERKRAHRARVRADGRCTICSVVPARDGLATCERCGKAGYDRVQMSRLIAEVDRRLLESLGTSETQGSVDGRYGEAGFLHHQPEYGILQYQIMLLRGPAPRRVVKRNFVWRETSAKEIADDLIATHQSMIRRRPRI
jgi:hypothetical protein